MSLPDGRPGATTIRDFIIPQDGVPSQSYVTSLVNVPAPPTLSGAPGMTSIPTFRLPEEIRADFVMSSPEVTSQGAEPRTPSQPSAHATYTQPTMTSPYDSRDHPYGDGVSPFAGYPSTMTTHGGDIPLSGLRDLLQEKVGATPLVIVEPFSNWVGEQAQDWVLAVRACTVPEVQAVVRGARALGLRVRGAGATHSWSPLFSDRGQVVVYVKDLQRPEGARIVLEPPDPHYPGWHLVTMATGVTTGEFLRFQVENDVCLPTNVVLREVTMGGVVLGGCHGAGWNMKSVSDHVARMRIVNSDGHLVEYSDKTDAEMMKAVKCNLGLFGIMVDMTLKCQPMSYAQTCNIWVKAGDIFYKSGVLYDMIRTNWSVEIFWFPFNTLRKWEAVEAVADGDVDLHDWDPKEDEVLVRLVNVLGETGQGQPSAYYEDESYVSWLQAKSIWALEGLVRTFPRWSPSYLRAQTSFLKDQFKSTYVQRLPHAIHFRDYVDQVKVHDMEWSFNINADCSNVLQACQRVVEIVQKEALEGRYPLNLPLEMRFIADSDAYMAPASAASTQNGGTGHTAYLEVLSLMGTPGWEDFCCQVASTWRHLPGARPHWCKEWSFLPGIDKHIRKSYRHQTPLFLSALERSGADPGGMFFNDYLEKLFYPMGHPGRDGLRGYTPIYPSRKCKLPSSCRIL